MVLLKSFSYPVRKQKESENTSEIRQISRGEQQFDPTPIAFRRPAVVLPPLPLDSFLIMFDMLVYIQVNSLKLYLFSHLFLPGEHINTVHMMS